MPLLRILCSNIVWRWYEKRDTTYLDIRPEKLVEEEEEEEEE